MQTENQNKSAGARTQDPQCVFIDSHDGTGACYQCGETRSAHEKQASAARTLAWNEWTNQMWENVTHNLGSRSVAMVVLEQQTLRSAREHLCCSCGDHGTKPQTSHLIKSVHTYYLCADCDAYYNQPTEATSHPVESDKPKAEPLTIRGVRFMKKGVKDLSTGKYSPCYYSRCQLTDGRTAITIYAKCILKGLPRQLQPQNDTDGQSDYFETDRARFYEGTAEYVALIPFVSA